MSWAAGDDQVDLAERRRGLADLDDLDVELCRQAVGDGSGDRRGVAEHRLVHDERVDERRIDGFAFDCVHGDLPIVLVPMFRPAGICR